MSLLTNGQRTKLLTLYNQYAAREIQAVTDPRAARLAWTSEAVGRKVDSFNVLTFDEASSLIGTLNGLLGLPQGRKPRSARGRGFSHMRDQRRARQAGTAGRRGQPDQVAAMVSADDMARIEDAIARLGWTQERFNAFLQSKSSPLGHRRDKTIRTLADANKVWWSMKALLKRAGKWLPADDQPFSPPGTQTNAVENECR